MKILNKKSLTVVLAAASALLLSTRAQAQIAATFTDVGGGIQDCPTTLGANDAYYISSDASAWSGLPDIDGGNPYPDTSCGTYGYSAQIFTTGTNPTGYDLTTVTIETTTNPNNYYQNLNQAENYTLWIFTISGDGTTATPVPGAIYTATGTIAAAGDWFEWTGLNTILSPNTTNAYAMGQVGAQLNGGERCCLVTTECCGVANQNNGQAVYIPSSGGAITYGTPAYGSFDVGLSFAAAQNPPVAGVPTYTPNINPTNLYGGTAITLVETIAPGAATPVYYQWLADGGTGTLAPVGGWTTNFTLPLSAAANLGFSGTYQYAVAVSNSLGTNTSPTLALNFIAASAPIINSDITPAGSINVPAGTSGVTFSATFVGTQPITYQWTQDPGTGPTNIANATNNTLVLNNVQAANVGTYVLNAYNSVGGSTPTPSSPSTLALVVVTNPIVTGSYAAAVLADNPVGFWPLNESQVNPASGVATAVDVSGHHFNGTYDTGCQNGYNGILGPEAPAFPGFPSNNTAVYENWLLRGS